MDADKCVGVIILRYIHARLQFLHVAGVRPVNVLIAGAGLQQLLHFFGNF